MVFTKLIRIFFRVLVLEHYDEVCAVTREILLRYQSSRSINIYICFARRDADYGMIDKSYSYICIKLVSASFVFMYEYGRFFGDGEFYLR